MTPTWTAQSSRCPCCTNRLTTVSWMLLCDGCAWYAHHLASCPHLIDRAAAPRQQPAFGQARRAS